jgi:hypothetical protein
VFRVRRQELEGADGEAELVGVRELPDANPQGHQLVARDVGGALHDVLPHIVHALYEKKREEKFGVSFVKNKDQEKTLEEESAGPSSTFVHRACVRVCVMAQSKKFNR